jgi:hypothetical protein
MMDDGRLREYIDRVNRDQSNGQGPPMAPVGVEPRPSGWICPVCGTEADQRVEPYTLNGEPVPGALKWLTLEDGITPAPVNISAVNIVERDKDGNPTKIYHTRHCMTCFNAWQRRKMMEEIRANVPQLVRKPDA